MFGLNLEQSSKMFGLNPWSMGRVLGSARPVWRRLSWTWTAACMTWIADAAGRAWAGCPPTSSQAATQRAEAMDLGPRKARWCMGWKTTIGSRIRMAQLRWALIWSLMDDQ
uniref:Uncharacterized protein n=1 Tax=Opuntia streptacantha TaxID=393608 RepID=A0A7C8ZXM3_OPUST